MDAIERAIRSAFEKGNAEDRAFRERVYRKAFDALDRGIQANPNLTVEQAIRRRKSLQAKIAEIETEFIPAVLMPQVSGETMPGVVPPVLPPRIEPVAPPLSPRAEVPGERPEPQAPTIAVEAPASVPTVEPVVPSIDPPSAVEPEPVVIAAPPLVAVEAHDPQSVEVPEPRLDTGTGETPPVAEAAPALGAPDAAPPQAASTDPDLIAAMRVELVDARQRRKRRPWAYAFIAVTVLALLAVGALWAWQTGMFGERASISEPIEQAPPEGEDFIPEAEEPPALSSEADPQRDWITIFVPADASNISAPSGASAEALQDESGSYLRIRSNSADATVVFDIGQGTLEQLAGKTATFDIVARSLEGEETQMAVLCNFGELGDCGRKRYAVGYARGDYLFELTFPDTRPGAGGTIAINSDFDGKGRAVDIYEIKVSVGQ